MDGVLLAEQGAGQRPKSAAVLDGDHQLQRDLDVAESRNLTLETFYNLPQDEQDWWSIRHERDQNKCSQCGADRSECSDAHRDWYPQRTVCYQTMAAAAATAKWERLHDGKPYHDGTHTHWAEKPDDAHPYHRDDGVRIWVAPVDLNPQDDFLDASGGDPFGDTA